MHGVGATLTPSQIDKTDLTIESAIVFENHLHDGVGARTFRIGTSGPTSSECHSDLQCLHDRLSTINLHFSQVDNVNLLLSIFSAMNWRSVIEQVKEFTAVNFVKGQVKLQVCVHVQVLNDVVAGKKVQSRDSPITRTHHREGLATTCLSVCKASRLGTFECL